MSSSGGQWTVSQLTEVVARTDAYAGGGVVAAMSLVGAAATAELVFQLSARRRDLGDDDLERLTAMVERCRHLRSRFLEAIDEDIAALSELMAAQSQSRRARKSPEDYDQNATASRFRTAVEAAIETPLNAARDATALLADIQASLPLARTFTVSDLGAAAATTHGAIQSLLLMAEVNLGMVDDVGESERLSGEIDRIARSSADQAEAIIATTKRAISAHPDQDGQ